MQKPSSLDLAKLLLRLTVGVMFVSHGLLKVLVFTIPGTAGFFASVGFPAWSAYIVTPAEIIIGIALILGVYTRLVALASLPILIGAMLVHIGNGWVFSNPNGGWEYPLYLIATTAVLALLGGGNLALTKSAE